VSGNLLAWLALAVALAALTEFARRVRAVAMPQRRTPFDLAFAAALGLGLAAFARGTDLVGSVAAGVACLSGGVFLAMRLQSAQAPNRPAVAVGHPILGFTAPDEHGQPFALDSLHGRPFLLKFFRGHW